MSQFLSRNNYYRPEGATQRTGSNYYFENQVNPYPLSSHNIPANPYYQSNVQPYTQLNRAPGIQTSPPLNWQTYMPPKIQPYKQIYMQPGAQPYGQPYMPSSYPLAAYPFALPSTEYNGLNPKNINIILIAILILVSLDLIVVRPVKNQAGNYLPAGIPVQEPVPPADQE